jgi:hypothetical protein
MSRWKEVIVGDALHVPSRDFNYYRDRLLVWPFLLFMIAAIANVFSRSHDFRLILELIALSIVSLLIARERLILIGIALGVCLVQSLLSFLLKHDWVGLAVGIPSGVLFLVLVRSLKGYKPSYGWPKGLSIVDLLVSLSSLGISIAMLRWMVH